jgi:hypothetical protein
VVDDPPKDTTAGRVAAAVAGAQKAALTSSQLGARGLDPCAREARMLRQQPLERLDVSRCRAVVTPRQRIVVAELQVGLDRHRSTVPECLTYSIGAGAVRVRCAHTTAEVTTRATVTVTSEICSPRKSADQSSVRSACSCCT